MSKTIKYRAWNKKTKRFIEKDTDLHNREGYSLGEYALSNDGKLYFFESTDGGMEISGHDDDDIEVIFFTGLLDKNGREIYEGDILSNSALDEKYEVVFDEGCFYTSWGDVQEQLSECSGYMEIMCNIYENPELLKGQL